MRRVLVGAALLLAVGGGAWLALTTFASGPAIARWAPCPRNWGWAPAWRPRASPLEALPISLQGGRAKLCYGRPSLRGRNMLGGERIPWGALWRLGANEPTTLHADRPFSLGDLELPAGSFALYAIPDSEQWEILVNASTDQWGIEALYPEETEIGRFSVQVEALSSPIETLTVTTWPGQGPAEELVIAWEHSRVKIPIRATGSP